MNFGKRFQSSETHFCVVYFLYLSAFIPGVSTEAGSSYCNNSLTSDLRNDQFSSSSVYEEAHNASAAKWDGEGWIASEWNLYQYLQIDLEELWEITSVQFRDLNKAYIYAKSLRIFHSNDGVSWTAYNTYTTDEILGETFLREGSTTTVTINPVIKTRYIAFNPRLYSWRPSIRLELYGCKRGGVPNGGGLTRIDTDIETNTVWIPSQSPIIIDKLIEVRPLASLIVQAGVSVVFTSPLAGIKVHGSLTSVGIKGFKTLFTSDNPVTSTKAQWKGIFLQLGGNISIRHTILRQADVGIQGDSVGITVQYSTIYSCNNGIRLSDGVTENRLDQNVRFVISHTKCIHNTDGLTVHGTNQRPYFYIDNGGFDSNTGSGFIVDNWDNSPEDKSTSIIVSNSTMDKNSLYGFKARYSYQLSLIFEQTSFSKNKGSGVYLYLTHYYSIMSNIRMQSSNFTDNVNYGLYGRFYCQYCLNTSYIFDQNLFKGNERSQAYLYFRQYSYYQKENDFVDIQITNNMFLDHINRGAYPLFIQTAFIHSETRNTNFEVVGNTFNNSNGGITITEGREKEITVATLKGNVFNNIYGHTKTVVRVGKVKLNFTENSVTNCSVPVLVDLTDGTNHHILFNNFTYNNHSTCLVKVRESYHDNRFITADYNFWGYADIDVVKSKMCDFFLDSSKARVLINTYYPDVDMSSSQSISSAFDFTHRYDSELDAYVVGGVIHSAVDTSVLKSENVIVNRTIIIDKLANVELSGIAFNLTQQRGFVISGKLQLGKLGQDRTTLRGHKGDLWNGLHIYNTDLKIANTDFSDADIILDINAYGTVNVNGSSIYTKDSVVNIQLSGTEQVNITFERSTLNSKKGITVKETGSNPNKAVIGINMQHTTMKIGTRNVFDVNFCSGELQVDVVSSKLTSETDYSVIFNIIGKLIDLSILTTDIIGGRKGIYVEQCYNHINGLSGQIQIRGNTFSLISETVLEFNGNMGDIDITDNTFVSNVECVNAKLDWFEFRTLRIVENNFQNNNADGIIRLSQPRTGNAIVEILQNVFENNTGTVVTFTSPNINILKNIFENENVDYTLRVLPGLKSYKEMTVNASLNYWGTTDLNRIAKYIYDHDYDESLLDVTFRPYLGSRNYSDIRNKEATFVSTQGEIGGRVNGDITLNKGDSPYLVVSNIVVGEKDILRLEAGVVVVFKEGLGIDVFGVLISSGMPDSPVKMVPELDGKQWRGLHVKSTLYNNMSSLQYLEINDTKEGITVTSSNTVIYNVSSTFSSENGLNIIVDRNKMFSTATVLSQIKASKNMKTGILISSSGLVINETAIEINQCTVYQNYERGLHVNANASVTLNNCLIQENRKIGIYIDQKDGGNVEMKFCTILQNRNYAIYEYFTEMLLLDSCRVADHHYRFYTRYAYHMKPYIVLRREDRSKFNIKLVNNIFENNIVDGIEIVLKWTSRGNFTVHIENNTFTAGNRTLFINFDNYYSYENLAFIRFLNNVIENNTNSKGALLECKVNNVGSVVLANNMFENNMAEQTVLLSGSNKRSTGEVIIRNNELRDFAKTSLIDIKNYHSTTVIENVLKNADLNACAIRAPNFDNVFKINATHNYWGTSLTNHIMDRVCGFEKDMKWSFIYYIPYYLDKELETLTSGSQDDFNLFGIFGGELIGNLTLEDLTTSSPIFISRSIFVRNDAHLHIPQDIRLKFKENTGIYVKGTLAVTGLEKSPVMMSSVDNQSTWYGIVLNSTGDSKAFLHHFKLINAAYGLVAHTNRFEFKHSSIYNSSSSCVELNMKNDMVHNLEDVHLAYCKENGISLKGEGIVTMENVDIKNAKTGLYMYGYHGHVNVMSSRIWNCTQAINVGYRYSSFSSANFTLDGCQILNCDKGIEYSASMVGKATLISIKNNKFTNISQKALWVNLPSYEYRYDYSFKGDVDIGFNIFNNATDIYLKTFNNASMSFHDNKAENISIVELGKCLLHAFAKGKHNIKNRRFNVSTNVFTNINSYCVVKLESSEDAVENLRDGVFYYNQFLDTRTTMGTILLDTAYFNLSHNIFDNPKSEVDLYVKRKGVEIVNASNNWWGTGDTDIAYGRIYDIHVDNSLIMVNVTPILTERRLDCSGVSNCSSNGECVSPNRCRCFSGWAGETCAGFDCGGVNSCYGNGVCIGPNKCSCTDGWTGYQCIIPLCSNVNECSGHGLCVRPDVCTCASRYTGVNCSECIPLHWGQNCERCPNCHQGTCNLNTGHCDCNGHQWTGQLCNECSETFYGPSCLPLMTVLKIIPDMGIDKGGNDVHVWGHNFHAPANNTYKCKFNTDTVEGKWVQWNHVLCTAPKHSAGMVTLEISSDGMEFTTNQLKYTFYATCPPGSCGRNYMPARGQCLYGGCSCNLPWEGENCTTQIILPLIRTPMVQIINATYLYSYQMKLDQGSKPIRWFLDKYPNGMKIDQRTGLIHWNNIVEAKTPFTVKVTATNIVGKHSVEWEIYVPISYSVILMSVEPSGVFPRPSSVDIFGQVIFNGSVPDHHVDITVEVKSANTGQTKVLSAVNDHNDHTPFMVTYNPRPDDSGIFIVTAHHPAVKSGNVKSLTWSVMGMRCEPSFISWTGHIDDDIAIYRNISTLLNTGGHRLNNISAKVYGWSDAFVFMGVDIAEMLVLKDLQEKETMSFGVAIKHAKPIRGHFYVIFSTEERTTARLQINIELSIRKPVLIFEPTFWKEIVVRGTQKVSEITITNVGEIPARNVVIDMPNDKSISLVSFSSAEIGGYIATGSSAGLFIPPQSKAIMSLAITIDSNVGLGELFGTIAVRTNVTTFLLSYKIFISSVQQMNLTFIIKDEYSYFASGFPLVHGAEVRLVNPTRGYSESRYSLNDTGRVIFEDIYEDRYTLYAQADNHKSYSAIIVASPDNAVREIFLQRIAVTYTWTVTPTTATDVYRITLDSTFETFVPMPVVTIEPAYLDTLPFEQGKKDTIDFTITNHGFIRADDLLLSLPTGHPTLHFNSTINQIGDLDANTTIIVPVRITPKTRTRRSGDCAMALVYHYVCGGVRSYSAGVTLKGGCGRVCHKNCGVGDVFHWISSSGVGSSRSGSSDGSIVYNPITPLSCDCFVTVVKSCMLSYLPYVGCYISASGLAGATTGPDIALGVLDTVMACAVGEVCGVCGVVYTSIRCLMDLQKNCVQGRRRRAASSGVVNNVLETAKPVDNVISIMEEIFGDKAMFDIERKWHAAFKTVVSDNSDYGSQLSPDEATFVTATLSNEASKSTVMEFMIRWNDTVAAWENGTLAELSNTGRVINLSGLYPMVEQYKVDTAAAKERGYDSIFKDFDSANYAYNMAEQDDKAGGTSKKDSAICATVRVRIVQDLVLARDAFNARLEIENGENSALENIFVQIEITRTIGTGELVNDLFSIGDPDLIGITAVDGTGRLGMDLSGSAEWLMIPYSEAAPEDDTLYDVGGRLSYHVGGVNFSVPLLPDTITVKPNPSLVVHYFHEKYVRGDDPLTPEIEPIVPFSLAVLVQNTGYGTAKALKISSAQPEIIENEKGLLVSFKIIGAYFGNQAMKPSLTVEFGNIRSFETKTARWLLTSTLMGTFYNFSATFENINPLGDPQLSLFEKLKYHELIHLVRLFNDDDNDDLDDFLVNDFVDHKGIPERVYSSTNGSDVWNVVHSNVTQISSSTFMRSGMKSYTKVQLKVLTNTTNWFYARIKNNITSPNPNHNQYLLVAVTDNKREIIVDKNVWLTTHILDSFFIHLFDFICEDDSNGTTEIENTYFLTFGPRNVHPPKFNQSSYAAVVSIDTPVNTPILKINAYDSDSNDLTYEILNADNVFFIIDAITGVVTVQKKTLSLGKKTLTVRVYDDGIPSMTSSTQVSVIVTSDNFSTTEFSTDLPVSTTTNLTTSMSPLTSEISTLSASTQYSSIEDTTAERSTTTPVTEKTTVTSEKPIGTESSASSLSTNVTPLTSKTSTLLASGSSTVFIKTATKIGYFTLFVFVRLG